MVDAWRGGHVRPACREPQLSPCRSVQCWLTQLLKPFTLAADSCSPLFSLKDDDFAVLHVTDAAQDRSLIPAMSSLVMGVDLTFLHVIFLKSRVQLGCKCLAPLLLNKRCSSWRFSGNRSTERQACLHSGVHVRSIAKRLRLPRLACVSWQHEHAYHQHPELVVCTGGRARHTIAINCIANSG